MVKDKANGKPTTAYTCRCALANTAGTYYTGDDQPARTDKIDTAIVDQGVRLLNLTISHYLKFMESDPLISLHARIACLLESGKDRSLSQKKARLELPAIAEGTGGCTDR